MDDQARVAADLLDVLKIGKAVVGGVSMGGYAAFSFARLFPERLLGLLLADTRPAADTDEPVPFPDFGQPSPPAVGPAPVPGATTCPGGGIATQVVSTSITQTSASSVDLVITGSAVNNTTAPVVLDISLTITHNGTSQPKPWVSKVNQSRPTVSPGETSNWTFTGTLNGGTSASVSAIGGGFRWADPAHASCQTQ
jgi:pimeloyl-ACP methyl ester carboxylesterase